MKNLSLLILWMGLFCLTSSPLWDQDEYVLVSRKVSDISRLGVKSHISFMQMPSEKLMARLESGAYMGNYEVEVPFGYLYQIKILKDDFQDFTYELDLREISEYTEMRDLNFTLKPKD